MKFNRILSMAIALLMVLSLCTSAVAEELKPYEEALLAFPNKIDRQDATAIEGGTLRVALVASSAFAGTLNPLFYQDTYDAEVLGWFTENMMSADNDFVFDQDGAATYEYDVDAKTLTMTLHEGIKWHDGEAVTMDDLLFAYEVICHPDYEGFRFDETFRNVVGVNEYHDGKADTISGIALSDDKMQMTLTFVDFTPSVLVSGFWIAPLPRHYYGDIAVKDMENHEKTRMTPIGFGPFKIKNIVPGEAVEYERFDDYWRGTPKLDGVVLTVVAPELIPTAMQEGQYDIAAFSTQDYPDYLDPTNYVYTGELQTAFNYTGFKLGTWDQVNVKNIYNPESKMANVKLRQAIGYAIDNQAIADSMYNGLRFVATTVITPRHASYQNNDIEGYTYNPELAKQLLDEAGYVDVDGDGFREDPNGEQFVITWATMEGQGADTMASFKMQGWNDVGLNVVLYNDRPTEFNAFYDAVEFDDPAIDMYDAAWQTGFDPNPAGLWGSTSTANYTRYTSDTFDKVMAEISSDAAWDSAYLTEKYHEFQQMFFDEAPAIPTLWRIGLTAVNNRVKFYDLVSMDIEATAHLIELSADEPEKK